MTNPLNPVHPPVHLDCKACGSRCCHYFALQIDTPTNAEEYDYLRWYISHEDVAIFLEGRDWYLQINRRCKNLSEDGGCGIYDTRPQICRDYGWDPTGEEECHGANEADDHDHFFSNREELEAYLTSRGKRWTKSTKTKKPSPRTGTRGRKTSK